MTRARGLSWAVLASIAFTIIAISALPCESHAEMLIAHDRSLVRSMGSEEPRLTQWVHLPAGTGTVSVDDFQLIMGGQAYTLPGTATISRVMIMRGQAVCTVSVLESTLEQHLGLAPGTLADLGAEAPGRTSPERDDPPRIQWAHPEGGASRYQTQGTSGAAPSRHVGVYLIIAGDLFVPGLDDLVAWKGESGFDVRVYAMSEIGNTVAQLQAFIQTAYDTWEDPPLYVLLVGDVEHVPTYDVHGNVSDHPYACVDGDDWLADLYIGRLSVKTISDVANQITKTVHYEKTPYIDGPNWFNRALMVAGNSGSSTPVSTCRWVADQLEDIGYQRADSCYFPPIRNGTSKITEVLDAGVGLVGYRGWAYGDLGWEPPRFTNDELPGINNGWMLPVVFSLVCHTGNYGNPQTDCFGEAWMKVGSATDPKGAVGFIGTGEHWSHSRWNDQMIIGIFDAYTNLGVHEMGHLLVATKNGLVKQFPTELEMGPGGEEESVEYYHYIYNLLGDPSLTVWTDMPRQLSVTVDELAVGQDFLPVIVMESDGITPVAGAQVAVSQHGSPVGYAITDAAGHADVSLMLTSDADVKVTVTGENLYPHQRDLPIHAEGAYLVCSDAQVMGGDRVAAGSTVDIDLTIANTGTQSLAGISVAATAPAGVTLLNDSFSIAALDAGAETVISGALRAVVDPMLEHGMHLRLLIESSAGGESFASESWLLVDAPALSCEGLSDGDDDIFDPGEQFNLTMTLGNAGAEAGAMILVLRARVPDMITISDSTATMPSIPPGETGTHSSDPFTLKIDGHIAVGTPIAMELEATHASGAITRMPFSLVVGQVDFSAPTGPDEYGYYCYDSADIDYPGQVPTYRWIECSPRFGGRGTEIGPFYDNLLGVTLELPFPFTYYGVEYDSIRVHDNGWIAFDTSYWYDIRNWAMPSEWGSACQVAPFWDNLVPPLSANDPFSDGIYIYHDEGQNCFVVEWSRLQNWENLPRKDYQTFQVVLRHPDHYVTPTGDGEIIFQYKQIVDDDYIKMYSTVGIEDHTETVGIQYVYANSYAPGAAPLASGLAIKFTTEPPVHEAIELARFDVRATGGMAGRTAGLEVKWHYDDERPLSRFRLERARLAAGSSPVPGTVTLYEALPEALLAPASGQYTDLTADPEADYAYRMIGIDRYGKERVIGETFHAPGAEIEPLLQVSNGHLIRGGTLIRYSAGAAELRGLEVFDIAGRRVRDLWEDPSGNVRPASGEVAWDGRDDRGHPLPGGVYWVRMRTEDGARSTRLVIVR